MNAQHTSGPWQQTGWQNLTVKSTAGVTIAPSPVADGDTHGLSEHQANARLIAAAPEQHALLVEALDLVPRINDDDPMAPALAEWCTKARAAIQKARGE